MQSHAYVERIDDGIVVLEVRLTETDYVPPSELELGKRFRYPRKKACISLEEITSVIPGIKARDVIVVEHTEGNIEKFCYLDHVETQRRFERAQERSLRLKQKIQQNKSI